PFYILYKEFYPPTPRLINHFSRNEHSFTIDFLIFLWYNHFTKINQNHIGSGLRRIGWRSEGLRAGDSLRSIGRRRNRKHALRKRRLRVLRRRHKIGPR